MILSLFRYDKVYIMNEETHDAPAPVAVGDVKKESKKERMAQASRRAHSRKRLARLLIVAGVVLVGFGLISWYRRSQAELPGTVVSAQGRDHIAAGAAHEPYNSNPPTSGAHFANPARWGTYAQELPDEQLVHNLEHGGIWISYRPGVPQDLKLKLEEFYKKWGSKIIVTPRAANDADIAVVAWGRLEKFSAGEFSVDRVEEFIKAYRNRGPEFTVD